MFTDIEGYSGLMQQDERHAHRLRHKQKVVLENATSKYSGQVVHHYGDGTLSMFESAKNAIRAAKEIQQSMQQDPYVPLRLGLHMGDIVLDYDGVYGHGVNLAARIEALSVPGAVLFSSSVHQQIKFDGDFVSRSLGYFRLKNILDTIEVFALEADGLTVPKKGELPASAIDHPGIKLLVLPLANLNHTKEAAAVCMGLTEQVMCMIDSKEYLSIIAHTLSERLATLEGEAFDQMAFQLGITYVLKGSVQTAAGQLKVYLQLHELKSEIVLFSGYFKGSLEHPFDLQDQISDWIQAKLPRLTKTNLVSDRNTVSNQQLAQLYSKGIYYLNSKEPDQIDKARVIFEDIIHKDPDFHKAYSSLSQCYCFLGSCGYLPPQNAYTKAHEFALAAIEKNGLHADSFLSLAMIKLFYIWDWQGTKASLLRAEELGLSSPMLHQIYGIYHATTGATDWAVESLQKAVDLDPASASALCQLAHMYLFNNQVLEALAKYEDVLHLDNNYREAVEGIGFAHLCLGNMQQALESLEQYHTMTLDPLKGLTGLVLAYVENGQRKKAEECLRKILQRQLNNPHLALEIDLAIAYYGLGDVNQCLSYLNKVYEKRFAMTCTGLLTVMHVSYFKNLWCHPDYKRFLAKINLH